MILADIKKYLSDHSEASLWNLCARFNTEPDTMRGMLKHWIRKGRLRELPKGSSCLKCCRACNSDCFEIYEWIERGQSHAEGSPK